MSRVQPYRKYSYNLRRSVRNENPTMASTSSLSQDDDMVCENLNQYEEFIAEESVVMAIMKNTIFKLTERLIIEYELSVPKEFLDRQARTEMIKLKIEGLFSNLVQQISEHRDPVLQIRNRESWNNCIFDEKLCLKSFENCVKREIRYCSRKSLPKFCLIYFILGKIYKLLNTGQTCTKRELYYQNLEFISDQSALDSALNEISCLLDCPLYHLNLYATSKGRICGPLKIITQTGVIDCSLDNDNVFKRGTSIPHDVCNIVDLKTDAKFVLLIEKDAVFQKLIDNDAMKKLPPCLFVTGKGMPDINTRSLLKTMWDILHIPILAFVDSDPWGLDIVSIYRFGSRTLSHQADQLAVPSIRWFGIFPSEVPKFCEHRTPLTDLDRTKLQDLMERPYIRANKKIYFEIQYMLTTNFKAEIEDLEFSVGHLVNTYLPEKIALGDFI